MIKVKICGLTRVEDISYVNQYQPDYVGFVFAKSKRQIDVPTARKLKNLMVESIIVVGVFVNEDIAMVENVVEEGIIDMIQLHGEEDEEYINQLRQCTNVEIIKAVKVRSLKTNFISTSADYILLDSDSGSGKTFDWNQKIICNKPIILAGGLKVENVSEAITIVKPYAVDVSSGVETNGHKDVNKIRKFMEESRRIHE